MIILTVQIETDEKGATGLTLRSMASREKTQDERNLAEEIWNQLMSWKREHIVAKDTMDGDEERLNKKGYILQLKAPKTIDLD